MNITQPKMPKAEKNDNLKSGQFASKKVIFGPHHEYSVYAVHTRFDKIMWFVENAEIPNNDDVGTSRS